MNKKWLENNESVFYQVNNYFLKKKQLTVRSPFSGVDCDVIATDVDDDEMDMLNENGNIKEIRHIDNNMIFKFCNQKKLNINHLDYGGQAYFSTKS